MNSEPEEGFMTIRQTVNNKREFVSLKCED